MSYTNCGISLDAVVCFRDIGELASTGLDPAAYGRLSYIERQSEYPRSQEIAEACAFLGADGLLVPSARDQASNRPRWFSASRIRVSRRKRFGITGW